jgi:putative transposase
MDQDTLRFLLREAVRETVTEVLQTVLELDRTAFLQAHGGRRNGYYPRRLETTFGQVDLKVPRDREGQYYPAFLKPYARRLVDVGEVAVALYAAGVSQRKAAEVMSLLLGHRYSHETISAMTEEVLQAVEAFRRRPLPEEMAFVYLDGLYLKLLREGEGVVREVVYVALGVTPSGERQVLGYWLLPAESALGWEGVLGELWQRGLRRVLLFITDGLPGLPEAIRRVYPQAEWQRCVVHGVRWSLGQVRARDRTLLAEDLRRVYGAESRGEALEALEALREAWGSRYPGVVALWAGDSGAFLRFYGYPKVLWPYLRSTNLMERFIREIRRGTKVRDHKFPSEEAVYEVGGAKAQGVLGGEGGVGEDASGAVCPPYTNAYTYFLTRPSAQGVGVGARLHEPPDQGLIRAVGCGVGLGPGPGGQGHGGGGQAAGGEKPPWSKGFQEQGEGVGSHPQASLRAPQFRGQAAPGVFGRASLALAQGLQGLQEVVPHPLPVGVRDPLAEELGHNPFPGPQDEPGVLPEPAVLPGEIASLHPGCKARSGSGADLLADRFHLAEPFRGEPGGLDEEGHAPCPLPVSEPLGDPGPRRGLRPSRGQVAIFVGFSSTAQSGPMSR